MPSDAVQTALEVDPAAVQAATDAIQTATDATQTAAEVDPAATLTAAAGIQDIIEAEKARDAAANDPRSPSKSVKPAFTQMMSSSDLLGMTRRPEYLIKGILVKGQPFIFGGASKTLKTSIAEDLVISLGSGTPFLGKFPVPRAVKVAFWTGESGDWTVRDTALRICQAKGIRFQDVQVDWNFTLPKLCRPSDLKALRELIIERQYEVVVVDPLYLTLLSLETAGSASNVYAMGAALAPVGEMGSATKSTVCLVHHFKRSAVGDQTNPCPLEDLTQAGASEWARQWLLLQRREPYQSTGVHELWMRAGGRQGMPACTP